MHNIPNRLSKVQEINLIKHAINNGKFLDHGSSRAVYSIGDNKVMKVAFDIRGQYQNHVEISTYISHGGSGVLAEIHSYGKHIVIMDEVTAFDRDFVEHMIDYDYESVVEDYEGQVYGVTEEDVWELRDTFEALENIMGNTSDNYQIGRDRFGSFVAYDYGYLPEDHDISVSDGISHLIAKGESNILELIYKKMTKSSR